MSLQQINLYRPELRPKSEWLTANSLAAISCGFAVLMVVAAMFIRSELREAEAQVISLEAEQAAVQARIKRIQEQPRTTNTVQLDRQIAQLKAGIAARESIGQIIQGQSLGNEAGFSESLNGFARQALDTVSLHHLRLSRSGEFVELKGVTQNPQDVPRYLQGLQSEVSFKTAQFGLLSVRKQAGSANIHEFAYGFESLYKLASQDGGK